MPVPRPLSRATRLPFLGAPGGTTMRSSPSVKPAALRRAAIAWAATVVSPTESVVLISTSSL